MSMSDNISIVTSEQCFGCTACANLCPTVAISMQEDEDGFLSPVVDEDLCTSCQLCQKACPALQDAPPAPPVQRAIITWNKDEKAHAASSSGGFFTACAHWIYNQGGYVCGASYDDRGIVSHIISSDPADMEKLRGSKYLQSNLGNCFQEIRKLLRKKKAVLFCGTPCQVAGLRAYLKKDYETLYTLDLVCLGAPSQRSFTEYLGEKFGEKQRYSYFNFRDKRHGYYKSNFVTHDEQGTELAVINYDDSYFMAFLNKLNSRQCCQSCHFSNTNRISDISLSDFWAVMKRYPSLPYEKGVSAIIINSKKGEDLLEQLREQLSYIKEIPIREMRQPAIQRAVKAHPKRELFFQLKNLPFSERVAQCLGTKRVGIMNFQDENANYGALLVSFSMKRVIEQLGYEAYNINYRRKHKTAINPMFQQFSDDYLTLTEPCYSLRDLERVQHQFRYIITGGDQVFNGFTPSYCLNWVSGKRGIISYAASMGAWQQNYYDENKDLISDSLSRFDHLCVREQSAVAILRELGFTAQYHIDSTLLLDKGEYDAIIEKDQHIQPVGKKYIACIIWNFEEVKLIPDYEELSKEYEFINAMGDATATNSFGQFLHLIKEADYVLANSYHGIVVSILYQKPFIAIRQNNMLDDRIISLFSSLKISQQRFIHSIASLDRSLWDAPVGWEKVEELRHSERERSLDYLRQALSGTPPTKTSATNHKRKIKLFGKLTIATIKRDEQKVHLLLFGAIPLISLKLRRRKIGLFGFLYLFRY